MIPTHSPTPWQFSNGSISDANNRLIADVWPSPTSEEWATAEPHAVANGLVMRASPQLLQELHDTIAWIETIAVEAERIGPIRNEQSQERLRLLCVKLRGRARLLTLSLSGMGL